MAKDGKKEKKEKKKEKKPNVLSEWSARITAMLLGRKKADKLTEEQKDRPRD